MSEYRERTHWSDLQKIQVVVNALWKALSEGELRNTHLIAAGKHIQGVLGEVYHRQSVIDRYRADQSTNPDIILLTGGDIRTPDGLMASDALIGILDVTRRSLAIRSVFEVTTAPSLLEESTRQHRRNLTDRFPEKGLMILTETGDWARVSVDVERAEPVVIISSEPIQDSLRLQGTQAVREIIAYLTLKRHATESVPLEEHRGKIRIDKKRAVEAFRQALVLMKNRIDQGIKGKVRRLAAEPIADRAHAIYCEDVDPARRPRRLTFRKLVHGRNADAQVVHLLAEAGVEKRKKVDKIDPERLRRSFQTAIERLQLPAPEGQEPDRLRIAELAFTIYCEGLPKEEHPSRATFIHRMDIRAADSALLKIFDAAGIEKREFGSLDIKRFTAALSQVLSGIEPGKKAQLSPRALVRMTNAVYCAGLPEEKWPTTREMEYCVYTKRVPEIRAIFAQHGIVVKLQKSIDPARLVASFRSALEALRPEIELARASGDSAIRPQNVADKAYEFYCANLPKSDWPNIGSLRRLSRSDQEVLALLEAVGIERERQVDIDHTRFIFSLWQALGEFKDKIDLSQAGKEHPVSPSAVAERAWMIYCRGLPEDQHPARLSFSSKVIGSRVTPDVKSFLLESGARWRSFKGEK